jgi:DNA replication and repair protein RecF
VATTLDVWDTKLVEAGTALARERVVLLDRLGPLLGAAYDRVANRPAHVEARYESVWWGEGLESALAATRDQDLRRGVSLVGPHRDDVSLAVGGLPARTQASQGEQRSLALAMRLAAHEVVTEAADTAPVLLLDDVFSELDPDRCDALLASLPAGQTVLTSASGLPPRAAPDQVLRIEQGRVVRT